MNAGETSTKNLAPRELLSTLWIVVMMNMLLADILSLNIPGAAETLAQAAGETPIPMLMLAGAIGVEISMRGSGCDRARRSRYRHSDPPDLHRGASAPRHRLHESAAGSGEECKPKMDAHVAFARQHADYKWNLEETWQLRRWMERSTPEEIAEMMTLIRQGRFGLGGGHSTLHSTKAGVEQIHRYIADAERLRRDYQVPIETVFHTDSPGLPWFYPRVLSDSGIRYLVVGMNLFIGGG